MSSSPPSGATAAGPAWAISMRVTSPVSARRVGSGSVDHEGAPGGGSGVLSGNSSSCGLGGRRNGRGMAISLMLIARAYPPALRDLIARPVPCQDLRKKGAQLGERGRRRDRPHGTPHRPARRGIQHPQRKLLRPIGRHTVEAAAGERSRAAPNHFVDANRQAEPGVPAVGDDRSVVDTAAIPRFMGLLS
jgi:hypothetical protein